jgi:hypothetical protein
VCSDADRASALLPGASGTGELADFFETLAARADKAIYRLIDSYAKQDAAAAFQLASLCKIDLLEQLPSVVSENCDQPPFLAMVMERVEKEPTRIALWAAALSEAGLRSSAVALALYTLTNPIWKTGASAISTNKQWFAAGLLPRNTYTECITFAINNSPSPSIFERLDLLRQIRAPGSYMFDNLWRVLWIIAAIVFVSNLSFAVFFYFVPGVLDAKIFEWSSLVCASLLIPLFFLKSVSSLRRRIYSRILNLFYFDFSVELFSALSSSLLLWTIRQDRDPVKLRPFAFELLAFSKEDRVAIAKLLRWQ